MSDRVFKIPISLYGYAFWAGDTRMCLMMQYCLNQIERQKILTECQTIDEFGISYLEHDRTLITNSKSFDYQILIVVYEQFSAIWTQACARNIPLDHALAELCRLSVDIKKIQQQLPVHAVQECLSKTNVDFMHRQVGLSIFNPFKRTVSYVNSGSGWYDQNSEGVHFLSRDTIQYCLNLGLNGGAELFMMRNSIEIIKAVAERRAVDRQYTLSMI